MYRKKVLLSTLLVLAGLGLFSDAGCRSAEARSVHRPRLQTVYHHYHRSVKYPIHVAKRSVRHTNLARKESTMRSVPSVSYREHSVRIPLQRINRDEPLWNKPFTRGAKMIGSGYRTIGEDRLVKPTKVATSRYKNGTYYAVERLGHQYGWINAIGLRRTKRYQLPYQYTSQFWPSHADDACEAASLKMALSTKGKGDNVPLAKMVKQIPRNQNPDKGYTNNPFKFGSQATISPKGLVTVARHYGVRAHVVHDPKASRFIYNIEHGNPMVFEGSYRMENNKSDHDLVLLGYKPGYFYYVDPLSRQKGFEPSGWVKISQFMNIFNDRSIRHQECMVVY